MLTKQTQVQNHMQQKKKNQGSVNDEKPEKG